MSTENDRTTHDRVGDEIFEGPSAAGTDDREVSELKELWDALGTAEQVPPRPELSDRVHERLNRDRVTGRWSAGSPWLRAAAVILVATGATFTWAITRPVDRSVAGDGSAVTASLISVLEVPGPTPARLAAIGTAYDEPNLASEAIEALVEIARGDPSVGVRIAAIDALAWLADRSAAREALGTLPLQASPLVQMALLENMAALGDTPDPIRRLLERSDLRPEVRARANEALVSLEESL